MAPTTLEPLMLYGSHRTIALILSVIFVCCCISPIVAQDDGQMDNSIQYSVDLSDVKNHYVTVTMRIPNTKDKTEVMMAVWTPGSYLIREYARNIDSIIAYDSEGSELPIEKIRKNRWQVESKDVDDVLVRYRIYCNEMTVRTSFVGREFAMLNGASVFMTVIGRLNKPHTVFLNLPRKWTRSATSLKAFQEVPNAFQAEDFDELVDSPIVAGNVNIYPFTVAGVPHQLVNVGESGNWDGTQAAADLKKIVAAHHDMWGNVPYERYLFINMIVGRGGGLEHNNSTVLMTSQWSYRDASRYRDWLSLASHEFFHTWNIRRLRPKSLIKYDYENEVYTPSLWVGEGITSYYEDLLLVRGGLISSGEYLRRLSSNIRTVQSAPGRLKQSLKESSYDTWIKFYRPDENSSNTRISYYSKGAVVAFLLDAKIREITEGKKSLDDVMRLMYQRHVKRGYTPSDFRKATAKIAGQDLADWFAVAVDSTEELDFGAAQDLLGMEFIGRPRAQILDPAEMDEDQRKLYDRLRKKYPDTKIQLREQLDTPADDSPGEPWLGFSGSTVSRIEAESPATEAGINTGDEIIAVNGYRLTGDINSRLRQYEIGDQLELLLARRGKMMTVKIKIEGRKRLNWSLKSQAKPSFKQQVQFARWLGQEMPEKPEPKPAETSGESEEDGKGGTVKSEEEKKPKKKNGKGKNAKDKRTKKGAKGKAAEKAKQQEKGSGKANADGSKEESSSEKSKASSRRKSKGKKKSEDSGKKTESDSDSGR